MLLKATKVQERPPTLTGPKAWAATPSLNRLVPALLIEVVTLPSSHCATQCVHLLSTDEMNV